VDPWTVDNNRTANAPGSDAEKSRGLGSYVVWAFVVVMVYVLSSGPAMRFYCRRPGPPSAALYDSYHIVYRPLWWAYHNTPLSWPLGMYWHLWVPEVGSNFF
jgi:hypothetical protein